MAMVKEKMPYEGNACQCARAVQPTLGLRASTAGVPRLA